MPEGNFGDKATGLFGWANNNPSSKNAIYDTEFINSAAGSLSRCLTRVDCQTVPKLACWVCFFFITLKPRVE